MGLARQGTLRPSMVAFVGRAEELAGLRGLISSARRQGAPSAGLISGEPGSGKSRLLRESIADVDPRRCVQLVGFEPTERIPLAAAADLIRRLAHVPDHGPRLQDLAFGSNDRTTEGALQVFEAANRALGVFGPLVLAVDDLQWVDAQSVGLIHYLMNAAESARRSLTVLAASRPSAAAISFADGVVRPRAEGRGVSINMRGLDLDDGVALARAINHDLELPAAEDLWRRAAGLPFWLEALARVRGSTDAADLITDRLRSLSADAGTLINTLAVAARPFSQEDLAAIFEWPAERIEHAVRELVGRGLAIDDLGHIRLAHDLIRESVSQAIPAATGRDIHARLAELLEGTAGDDLHLLAESLDHRMVAGLPVSDLAIRLVASPQRRLLGADDLPRLSSIADDLETGSAAQLELDRGLGRLASELGDPDLAVRHWSRVADRAQDDRHRLEAHIEAARVIVQGGTEAPNGEAATHLARARSLPVDPISAIQLDTLDAHVAMEFDHDTRAGTDAAERAVARGHELAVVAGGPGRLPAEARAAMHASLLAASQAAWMEERAEDLVVLIEAGLGMAEGLGEEVRPSALIAGGAAYRHLGNIPKAERLFRAAWEISDRLMLPDLMAEAGFHLARELHILGRLAEARAIARAADAVQARLRTRVYSGLSTAVLHVVDLARGVPGALARFNELAPSLDQHWRIGLHQGIATWIARRDGPGRATEIERHLAAAQADSDAIRCPRCAGELQVVSAELLARLGRLGEARGELAAWEVGLRGHGHLSRTLRRAWAGAAISMAAGGTEAIAEVESLAGALEEEGRLLDATWARLDLGRQLEDAGDRPGGIAAYTAAASLADGTGAVDQQRIAARALRRLGVRTWRRGHGAAARSGPAAMSAREREVAGLVAGGATNLDVATSLAISPRTVERHVTNILAKLGVRNRTELAARFRDPGTGFPR